MITYDQTLGIVIITMLLPPWMLLHFISSYPLQWIHRQYLTYKVLKFNRYMTWTIILSIQYLSIQFRSIFVFKGKKTTNHCKQNNSSTPNINHQRLIWMFSLNHLGCSITRWSTSSSQSLLRFICIRKTKVNYSNSFVIIYETIF